MEVQEILAEVGKARDLYNKGVYSKDSAQLEAALEISLRLREYLDSQDKEEMAKKIDQYHHLNGGLNAFIFNCMKLLGKYEDMIPYLERTLQYMDNKSNPDLWRQLGLLYLVNEQNFDKAIEAWRNAVALDPRIEQRYPGLSVVHVYNAMIARGEKISWKLIHANIETGDFSVSIGTG